MANLAFKVLAPIVAEEAVMATTGSRLADLTPSFMRPYRDMTREEKVAQQNEEVKKLLSAPTRAAIRGNVPNGTLAVDRHPSVPSSSWEHNLPNGEPANSIDPNMMRMFENFADETFISRVAAAHRPLVNEAMAAAGAASDVVYTPTLFARALRMAGVNSERLNDAARRIQERYPSRQIMQAVFKRWVINKVIPRLALSGIAGGAGYLVKRVLADKGRKGGLVEMDDLDGEIAQAERTVDTGYTDEHPSYGTRGFHRIVLGEEGFRRLDGSAFYTAGADLPMGPFDAVMPKSSPIYPAAPVLPSPTLPGVGIFHETMRGDHLSERTGDPRA